MIKNLEKINKIKRSKVAAGLKYIGEVNDIKPVVDKVVVFGSATREDCFEDSDIDLCLFSDYGCGDPVYLKARGGLSHAMGDVADILLYRRLNPEFKGVVDNGVVVYER